MSASKMPLRCVVHGCSNVPDIKNGIVLHKIPYDQDVRPEAIKRRKRWVDFVKRKRANWEPTNSSCICSRHFAPDAFERMLNLPGLEKTYRPLLKPDAVGIMAFPAVYAADETGYDLSDRQGCQDNSQGPEQNFIRGPMTSLFSNNKPKNQWTVLQSVENTYKRGLQCL